MHPSGKKTGWWPPSAPAAAGSTTALRNTSHGSAGRRTRVKAPSPDRRAAATRPQQCGAGAPRAGRPAISLPGPGRPRVRRARPGPRPPRGRAPLNCLSCRRDWSSRASAGGAATATASARHATRHTARDRPHLPHPRASPGCFAPRAPRSARPRAAAARRRAGGGRGAGGRGGGGGGQWRAADSIPGPSIGGAGRGGAGPPRQPGEEAATWQGASTQPEPRLCLAPPSTARPRRRWPCGGGRSWSPAPK